MTDYGRPVEFGYFPIPNADDYPQLVALARSADELGIDLIGVQDHPYQRRFLDTFSLLAALAVQTKRIRLSLTWRICHSAHPRCSPRPPPRST